jgi:hypothetical protein
MIVLYAKLSGGTNCWLAPTDNLLEAYFVIECQEAAE